MEHGHRTHHAVVADEVQRGLWEGADADHADSLEQHGASVARLTLSTGTAHHPAKAAPFPAILALEGPRADPETARIMLRTSRTLRTVSPLLLGLALLTVGACVSKKDHLALQKKFDESQAALTATSAERDAHEKRIDELSGELSEAEKRASEIQSTLNRLETELERTKAELDHAQQQLAMALASDKANRNKAEQLDKLLKDAARRRIEAEKRVAEFKLVLAKFKKLIDSGKLDVKIVDGRMVLRLPSDILFASGSAAISDDGKAALLEVGAVLATIPDRRFQIEGHTDIVPISTSRFPSNWELAFARANGVRRVMLEAGVKPDSVSAASFGEFRPAVTGTDDAAKQKNRRIEIVIVPDLTGLPGFEELTEMSGASGS
jgi:chemotaxis protein MotB